MVGGDQHYHINIFNIFLDHSNMISGERSVRAWSPLCPSEFMFKDEPLEHFGKESSNLHGQRCGHRWSDYYSASLFWQSLIQTGQTLQIKFWIRASFLSVLIQMVMLNFCYLSHCISFPYILQRMHCRIHVAASRELRRAQLRLGQIQIHGVCRGSALFSREREFAVFSKSQL